MKPIDMSQVRQEVGLNRRARLLSTEKLHQWVDFGPVTFTEAAEEYCRTFAGSLKASGDIEPGKPFYVQVAEDDDLDKPQVPPCAFLMREVISYEIKNPRLGSD